MVRAVTDRTEQTVAWECELTQIGQYRVGKPDERYSDQFDRTSRTVEAIHGRAELAAEQATAGDRQLNRQLEEIQAERQTSSWPSRLTIRSACVSINGASTSISPVSIRQAR